MAGIIDLMIVIYIGLMGFNYLIKVDNFEKLGLLWNLTS